MTVGCGDGMGTGFWGGERGCCVKARTLCQGEGYCREWRNVAWCGEALSCGYGYWCRNRVLGLGGDIGGRRYEEVS